MAVQDEEGDVTLAQVESRAPPIAEVVTDFEDEFDLRDEESWVSVKT